MSTPRHPLRVLRAATPHSTQAAFAAFLGVPAGVVQAVETGKARLTPRLAAHIRELTGADDVELLRGAGGRTLTVSGKRYTPEAFAAWAGSPQQVEERRRREAVKAGHAEGWEEHLRAALPRARIAKGRALSAAQLLAVEDGLTPWQCCEFASAPVSAWRRLPEGVHELTGWSPDLSLPPRTRLTLAVQSAPVWDPDSAPPGKSAANADLFPPCYFTVAAGSGGCRVAAAYWKSVCREHAIEPGDGNPRHGVPTGSWRGFFRNREGRCEPHAVFAGLTPEETEELDTGLFSAASFLAGPADGELADRTLTFIKEHPEDAGSPAGILLFVSLEGGTASSLSVLLLERLRASFPSVPVLVAGVLPLPGVSQVVTAPWHTARAMQAVRRHASAAVLFSNDLLVAQASREWGMRWPGYAQANLLIAECLTALTAPLRFGGSDSPPPDLATVLAGLSGAEEGEMPVLTGQCWPLAALEDRRLKTLTLPWLVNAALAAAGRSRLIAPEAAGIGLFLRVRLLPGPEFAAGDEPPVVKLSRRSIPGVHESAVIFTPSPVIRRTLRRLAREARAVCAQLGVTEEGLAEAIAEMER